MNREIKLRQFCSEEENHEYGMHYVDPYQKTLVKDGTWHTMQSTNLTDKNGKEIYEGDVLDLFATGDVRREVRWDDKSCAFAAFKGEEKTSDHLFGAELSEVIGNVWENPELLKV